jgi:hypothetical protein
VEALPTAAELVLAGKRKWDKFLHRHKLFRPQTYEDRIAACRLLSGAGQAGQDPRPDAALPRPALAEDHLENVADPNLLRPGSARPQPDRPRLLGPQFPTLNQPKTMTKKSSKKSLETYRTFLPVSEPLFSPSCAPARDGNFLAFWHPHKFRSAEGVGWFPGSKNAGVFGDKLDLSEYFPGISLAGMDKACRL